MTKQFEAVIGAVVIASVIIFSAPAGAENVVRMGKVDGMPTWDPQGARGDIAMTATGRCTRAWSWSMLT